MTQICNTVSNAAEPGPSPLFGNLVENSVAKGSAFFCSAFAEAMHLMAAVELNRPETLTGHLDTAIAYLRGAIDEYSNAARRASSSVSDDDRVARILRMDHAQLYEECTRSGRFPAFPSVWGELAPATSDDSPASLLKVFRQSLVSCLDGALLLRAGLVSSPLPEIETLWGLATKLAETLATGQAIAVIYQSSLREDVPLVAVS